LICTGDRLRFYVFIIDSFRHARINCSDG
jgi:hypothetical protein